MKTIIYVDHKYLSSCLSSDPFADFRESVWSLQPPVCAPQFLSLRMNSENSDQCQILVMSLTWHLHGFYTPGSQEVCVFLLDLWGLAKDV